MSEIPPARPIGTVTDPTACTIRPALEWEAHGEWRDIRYEIGRPEGANGAIAKITICRPEVRNAFRPQTLFELQRAFDLHTLVLVRAGRSAEVLTASGPMAARGVRVLNARVTALCELGRIEEAVAEAEEAHARAPGDPLVAKALETARSAAAARRR